MRGLAQSAHHLSRKRGLFLRQHEATRSPFCGQNLCCLPSTEGQDGRASPVQTLGLDGHRAFSVLPL